MIDTELILRRQKREHQKALKRHRTQSRRAPRRLPSRHIATDDQLEHRRKLKLMSNAAYDFPTVARQAAIAGVTIEPISKNQFRFTLAGFSYDFYPCHSYCPQLPFPHPCNLHDVLKAVIEDVDGINLGKDSPVGELAEGIAAQASETYQDPSKVNRRQKIQRGAH